MDIEVCKKWRLFRGVRNWLSGNPKGTGREKSARANQTSPERSRRQVLSSIEVARASPLLFSFPPLLNSTHFQVDLSKQSRSLGEVID